MKLHQLIAIVSDAAKKANALNTQLYKWAQKSDLYNGIFRVYTPSTEDGYVYPKETKAPIRSAMQDLQEFLDNRMESQKLIATQDLANTMAKADIVVNGTVLLSDIPVTTLLYLEKQLQETLAYVNALQILDISEVWSYDKNSLSYVSDPVQQIRTKKVTEYEVVVPPTKEHRAEIREVSKDIREGIWTATKVSKALSPSEKNELIKKVEDLIRAVKLAREEANTLVVDTNKAPDLGGMIKSYILSGVSV